MTTSHFSPRWPAAGVASVAILGLVAGAPPGAAASTGPPGRALAFAVTAKTVTNTNDSGAGSLRAAMFKVNNPGLAFDTILFNIPGAGRHVIAPLTDLPALTAPVTIDGYSQPGTSEATPNNNATLAIVINASGLSGGLELDTDDSLVTGLVVRDADSGSANGIRVVGDDNTIAGSYVGVTAAGEQAAPNEGNGVYVTGDGNVVGGTTPADRNVISANLRSGVLVDGVDNLVAGNRIGTDDDGTTDLGNETTGVDLEGDDNRVGTLPDGGQNLISGNTGDGVYVGTGSGNEIRGNLIGTDVAGTGPLGNGDPVIGDGVTVETSDTTVSGNVIAANTGSGVLIEADRAIVRSNVIGTDANGTSALPNELDGVFVDGSDSNIGGPAGGNVIAGNLRYGVWIHDDPVDLNTGNVVRGNLVGTDATGTQSLGNGAEGVRLDASETVVGGSSATLANVISGNGESGLHVSGDDNEVEGNFLGTDLSGALSLPNAGDGIEVTASNTEITDNTVAFNDEIGIDVFNGTANPLVGNSIYSNTDLGIDLEADGATANDNGDGDAGANDLLNYPIVKSVATTASGTDVTWKVRNGLASTDLQLEFFVSDVCSAPASSEGEVSLGTANVTTDAGGDVNNVTSLTGLTVAGQFVTATATIDGATLGSTSEFSACTAVA